MISTCPTQPAGGLLHPAGGYWPREERAFISRKRKRYRAAFKAKVAVAAIRGVKIIAELASEHQVHPTLLSQWKRQALENWASLFEGGITRSPPDIEAISAPLYEQFGRLKVELDWLKKSGAARFRPSAC